MKVVGELQTLSRGLAALAFINDNGLTDIAMLARHLDIPRGNTVRILKTLTAEGYCTRLPDSRFYQVLPKVRLLACGAREGELLTSVSIAVIEKLGKDVEWPVALATPSGSDLVLRLTTDRSSALALNRFSPGFTIETLLTPSGIAYLAHIDAERRAALLGELRARNPHPSALSFDSMRQDQLIAFAATHGYSVLQGNYAEGGAALPVFYDGRPIGCVSMRYMRRGMHGDALINRYLPRLREAVADIERLYLVVATTDFSQPLPIGRADALTTTI